MAGSLRHAVFNYCSKNTCILIPVSVIIPTFNYAAFISRAVESVLAQAYPPGLLQIVVVDDGGTDNTSEILAPWIKEGLVLYKWQPNQGKAAATRHGIELATGEIVFNLDADDWFLPGKIQSTADIFMQFEQVVHVASPALIKWENESREDISEQLPADLYGKVVDGDILLRRFFEGNILYGGGSTFSARISVLKSMEWNNAVDMYTDEWLLISCLLKGDSYFIEKPLSVWMIHGKNYSVDSFPERIIARQKRLLHSSKAILELLGNGKYPLWLKNIYQLKHEVRILVWKEEGRNKTISDCFKFLSFITRHKNLSKTILRKYHAYNRLLPTWLLAFLKRRLNSVLI